MTKKNMIMIGAIATAIALSLTIAWVGFGKKQALSPVETIETFHTTASAGKIEESKEFISKSVLDDFKKGSNWWMGSYQNFIKEYNEDVDTVTPLKETESINGDMATIDVEVTSKEGDQRTEPYILVKEGGEWKITYDY